MNRMDSENSRNRWQQVNQINNSNKNLRAGLFKKGVHHSARRIKRLVSCALESPGRLDRCSIRRFLLLGNNKVFQCRSRTFHPIENDASFLLGNTDCQCSLFHHTKPLIRGVSYPFGESCLKNCNCHKTRAGVLIDQIDEYLSRNSASLNSDKFSLLTDQLWTSERFLITVFLLLNEAGVILIILMSSSFMPCDFSHRLIIASIFFF